MQPNKKRILNAVLIVLVIIASIFVGYRVGSTKIIYIGKDSNNATSTSRLIIEDRIPPVTLNKDVDFNLFWKVWSSIKQDYVEQNVDDKKLFYGAIQGMVASLGDPYTIFLDPKLSKDFNDELSGEFEGIGAEIGIKNDRLTVISPLPGTPAEKAGLKSGDKIFSIDGFDTTGMYLEAAVSKIRGKKGTQVTLKIKGEKDKETREVKITRDVIKFDSVKWEMKGSKIAYIQVLHFNEDTEEKFNNAVSEIIKQNPQGVILDLRGNPGGFLDTAVNMASSWIEDGVIVTEKSTEEKKKEHNATGRAYLAGYKTVVLINKGSASASEIVAGALKDYGKAVLVGETTFGKGSVQSLESFEDGSSLKITIAKWLTPNGHCINEKGVDPDIKVELTDKDYNDNRDPQLDKAMEILDGRK